MTAKSSRKSTADVQKSDMQVLRERLAWRVRHFHPAPGVTLEEGSIHLKLLAKLAFNDAELHIRAHSGRQLDKDSRQASDERGRVASEENRRLLDELYARNCEPAGRCSDCGVILWKRPHGDGCGHAFDPNVWTTWGAVFHPPTHGRSGQVVEWFAAGEYKGQPCAPTPAMQAAAERLFDGC